MKRTAKFGAVLAAMALVSTAHGAMIQGTINFNSGLGGGVSFHPPNGIGSATAIVDFQNPVVTEASGSFAPVSGSTVNFTTPFEFNPPTPYNPLWRVESGAHWFEFELTSVSIIQTSELLFIAGTGIFTGNDYDPTPGVWRFSSQAPADADSGLFSWSSAGQAMPQPSRVPDGGATLVLLGTSLLGLHGVRRRFAKHC